MVQTGSIILAAGKGTRMNSEEPKVLHSVCERAMIDYVVDTAKAASSKICIVLGHGHELIEKKFGSDIHIALQEKLLGTADAIKSAQSCFKNFKGDILVLCGDVPLLKVASVRKLLVAHQRSKAACTFLSAELKNPKGYGRVIRKNGNNVVAIREDKDATPKEKSICEINTGLYCFKAQDLFDGLKKIAVNKKKNEYYLTDIISVFVKENKDVRVIKLDNPAEGLGINTRKDLAEANRILNKRTLDKLMDQGVTIVDPNTTYIGANVKVGQDTIVYPFAFIENDVVIGKRCKLGPFCHIRPQSRIKDGAQIGNFTEVSRSTVGEQSLMKHFGFLGDTVVGKKVNIGAGVVTANYDGIKKSKTVIGDQAFIGSDSILVAPVKIGKKAMTAAGCVVPKNRNVPNGKTMVGVPGRIKSKGKTNE
ncbi:MAG: NTP transferase domain-containing protein [Candidatus Omnitrophica bacterium]|nr:NTP transferase domain-containing protein [Candidatus Omnitrophota bacterium]